MNFAARLLEAGEPSAPALLSGGQKLTYADLRHEVAVQADALQDLPPNSRVALLADPGPFFVTAYLGVMAAGHCVVPLPIGQSEESWKGFLEHVEPARILASERWSEEAARLPVYPPHDNRELAALMFTSGSTGRPRAVMVTHENLFANTQDIVSYLELKRDDRCLAVLPFSYCYGASLLHTHLWVGASVVTESLMLYEKALDTLEREGCTGLAGVPSTYQILLRKSTFLQREPQLRWLQQAGGKLADPYLKELRQGLPRTRIFVMYGQTEATARLSYLPPEHLDSRLGSIGKGLKSTKLRLVDGEIVASGPNISPGYWRDPEATARHFRDGELYTGDLARADDDGFLYIEGRERHFIKSAGHRISPDEVEAALAAHPGVVECAVVGVPDELLGEAVAAFFVGPASPEELLLHCRKRLPNALVPTRWKQLDELPRGPAGKVLKEKLRV